MKKSTLIPLIAAVSAATVALAGCAGGCGSCSSCGGNNTSTTASLNSNWYVTPGYDGIQPAFYNSVETATYSVNYDTAGAGNSSYSVNYENGTYTTEFTATDAFDVSRLYEDYREDYTKSLEGGSGGLKLYKYTTELWIDVTFTCGGKSSEKFTDHITTETYFRPTGQNMRTVYSTQETSVHSPKNQQASSLDDVYDTINRKTETSYNFKNTRATVKTTIDGGEPAEKSYGVSASSFDSNIIYLAARAMGLSGGSQTVSVFYPMTGAKNSYTLSGGKSGISDEENQKLLEIANIGNAIPDPVADDKGNVPEKKVEYTCSTISLASGNLKGTEQKVWFAKVADGAENELHAAMLKIRTVLPYSLGSLVYLLKDITFAAC